MKTTKQAPAASLDREEVAAVVADMGATLNVFAELYGTASRILNTDRQRASTLLIAADRYLDDLTEIQQRLEGLVAVNSTNAEGGA